MKRVENKYRSLPFWSWNDELDKEKLVKQVEWMHENGIGGFFMHARGGLKTEYLGDKWHECIEACSKRAYELGMEAYAYDENGWPSGFVGGKLLEDIENHDRYLTYKIGDYDKDALVSYDISGDELVRVSAPCKSCLNVYEHYSASTADILNPELVDKFIALTHEQYRLRDKYELKGFFTDEPQYYRWDTPYTRVLPPYFKKTYGEDILDGLGLLFVEKKGYRAFRYKFWKSMQELMLENFAKKIYDWCDKYGYKLTGHYIEEGCLSGQMLCCAGIMPFYEYEHIPGIDYLGKWLGNELAQKQVSSVCAQLGKHQALTETFAGCGWNMTPLELKLIAESQYVGGVNLMCQHLLPYEEHGQRKRDYPLHFSSVNPWIKKGFREFNDYFAMLGKLLAESTELVNVGVLHPIRSAYFDYKRTEDGNCIGIRSLESSLDSVMNKLCRLGVGHHFLDEVIMARHARVENGELVVGECRYKYIILPRIYTMDKSTEALLREFIYTGGYVLMCDDKPEYLEGEPYKYTYLKTNTSWEKIVEDQRLKLKNNKSVRVTYRRHDYGQDFIYAVNLGKKSTIELELDGVNAFKSYDILSDTYKVVPTSITLDEAESCLLFPTSDTPTAQKVLEPLVLEDGKWSVAPTDNYITLDLARFSKNGIDFSKPLHHMCIFDTLLKDRHEGTLWLKYEVEVKKLPSRCEAFIENEQIRALIVNGIEHKTKKSDWELAKLSADVASSLVIGKNEIILELDYYQGENVYYALFGDNVTEGLKNCLAYDTELEPIYLKGDFGVYGSLKEHENGKIVIGSDFYIDAQPRKISSIVADGFPFLAGDITLSRKIVVDSTNKELIIDKPFHIIDVRVNGKYAGRMMMSNRLDLSRFLKAGVNELELTITLSNRNLLGPFHTVELEPNFVGPDTYERFGSWENGRSKHYIDTYALVKSII